MRSYNYVGGYGPYDGTIEFYGRIHSIVNSLSIVVDLGCGRGAWYSDNESPHRKSQRLLKGRVARVIGMDIDDAVLENKSTDENIVIRGPSLPFRSESADVVICDYVLEHILDPCTFEREVFRILKPGGFFCARTPHRWNYVSIAARIVKNDRHRDVLRFAQPDRKAIDVFPTAYRCNSIATVRQFWKKEHWRDFSYLYVAEPSYVFGSEILFRVFCLLHRIGPAWLSGNLFVFMQKRPTNQID